jgi:nicotinamide-nucleotide amidase
MSQPERIHALAKAVIEQAKAKGVMIATAESCTGGMIAAALTDISGSSSVVDRGFVTYSNEAKNEMLGVPMALIEEHGAVSGPVARAMAEGAVKHSRASLAVSVTGIAGPTGGTKEKPVGLVWFGVSHGNSETHAENHLFDNKGRDYIRGKAKEKALELLLRKLEGG